MLSFLTIFLPKERLEENEGWQLCCQVIPNSLIRTSPVQVLGVSHNMVVDLPLKGLQSYSGGTPSREVSSIPGMFALWKRLERNQCVHDKGALYKGAKRSHLKSKFFFLLILLFYTENWRFCCCIRTVCFLNESRPLC